MKIRNIILLAVPSLLAITLFFIKHNNTVQQSSNLLNTVWSTKIPLTGGLSDSLLYKVSDGKKSYVLRNIKYQGKEDRIKQIHAQKVASDSGYGPHLYAYHVDQGKILMAFLETSKENIDLATKALKMADLLKKIHNGPSLSEHESMIDRTKKQFTKINTYPKGIDREKILSIINKLESTKSTQTSPMHGDLNPGNIIFVNGEYKVIDFENAGEDDPFFDLATIIIYNFANTPYETEFLKHYFGRLPSPEELIHLNAMKQAVFLHFGLGGLAEAQQLQTINQTSDPIDFYELLDLYRQGKLSMEDKDTRFIVAHSRLKAAINLEQN